MMNPHNMGGMEVCPPSGGGAAAAAQEQGVTGDLSPTPQSTPGHRDRSLVYSTVGTPDYIAPEVTATRHYSGITTDPAVLER